MLPALVAQLDCNEGAALWRRKGRGKVNGYRLFVGSISFSAAFRSSSGIGEDRGPGMAAGTAWATAIDSLGLEDRMDTTGTPGCRTLRGWALLGIERIGDRSHGLFSSSKLEDLAHRLRIHPRQRHDTCHPLIAESEPSARLAILCDATLASGHDPFLQR